MSIICTVSQSQVKPTWLLNDHFGEREGEGGKEEGVYDTPLRAQEVDPVRGKKIVKQIKPRLYDDPGRASDAAVSIYVS